MQARAAAEAASQRPDPPDEPDRGAAFGLAAFRLRRIVQPIAWQADVVTLAANVPAEHARVRRGLLGRCIEEALAAADLQVRWYEAPAVSLQGPVPPAEAWDYLQEDTAAAAAVTRWRFDVEARTLCVALEEAAAAAPLERALQALLGPTWTLRVQPARPGWWLQPAPAWTDVQAWLLRQSASARGLALLSQLQPVAWQPAAARAAFRLPAAAARLAPSFARWVQRRLADRTGGAWAVDIAPGSDPAADCDGLRRALERAGVGPRAARTLARARPAVCLRQLLWHEDRLAALCPVANPGGLLAQAIREDYGHPAPGL